MNNSWLKSLPECAYLTRSAGVRLIQRGAHSNVILCLLAAVLVQ